MATSEPELLTDEPPRTYEDVVTDRRSVHDYADRDVTDDTLREVFELVRYTPSSYNLQPWEFVVVTDDERRETLRECAYDQEHVTDAPVAVIVLGNTDPAAHGDRVADDMLEKGYLPDEDARDGLRETFESMREREETERRLWATTSTALATMTLMHAARRHGLSTCPMGGFDPDDVREAFGVDDGYEVVALVTMGYAAEDASDRELPRKFRRPVDEIVHRDEFDA